MMVLTCKVLLRPSEMSIQISTMLDWICVGYEQRQMGGYKILRKYNKGKRFILRKIILAFSSSVYFMYTPDFVFLIGNSELFILNTTVIYIYHWKYLYIIYKVFFLLFVFFDDHIKLQLETMLNSLKYMGYIEWTTAPLSSVNSIWIRTLRNGVFYLDI